MSNSSQTAAPDTSDDLAWLEVVRQKVAKLRFGSVQTTMHDGRVNQVGSVEKTRFSPKTRERSES